MEETKRPKINLVQRVVKPDKPKQEQKVESEQSATPAIASTPETKEVISQLKDTILQQKKVSYKDTFPKLTLEEIRINLKLLSRVKENQKLYLRDNKFLDIDTSYMQSVTRSVNNMLYESHNRLVVLEFLEFLVIGIYEYSDLILTNKYSNSNSVVIKEDRTELLRNLYSNVDKGLIGITNFKITYNNDNNIQSRLEELLDNLNKLINKINSSLTIK